LIDLNSFVLNAASKSDQKLLADTTKPPPAVVKIVKKFCPLALVNASPTPMALTVIPFEFAVFAALIAASYALSPPQALPPTLAQQYVQISMIKPSQSIQLDVLLFPESLIPWAALLMSD